MLIALTAGQRVRFLLQRRRLAAEAARDRGRVVGLAVLGGGFGLLVFAAALGAGWFVTMRGAPDLLLSGTGATLWGLGTALVFSSLGHAAQAFFQAKDLWMWDSAPTGAVARFTDRLTETAVAAVPPTMAIGTCALTGFALGGGLGVGGAVRALVAVLLVVPLPVCIGVVFAHVGGAILPAGRLRRLSLLLLGGAVTAVLVWFRQARVERLLTEQGANDLLKAAKETGAIGPALSPPRQLANFVVDGDAFGFFVGVVSLAAFVGIAFAAHALLYDRARKLAVDEAPTGVLRGSLTERVLSTLTRVLAPDLRPLVRKDLLAFVRDPAQWGQVVLLVGVGVLYLVNATALRDGMKVIAPPWGGLLMLSAHTGIVGFIAGGLAARFAFPQLGLEGPAIWILDGAPLPPGRLLIAKWVAAFPIVVVFPAALAVAGTFALDFSPLRALWSTTLLIAISVGIAGIAVFRGAQHPLFDAVSLSELAMGPGAVSTMLLATTLAFVGSVASLIAGALFAYREVVGVAGVACGAVVVVVPIAMTAGSARSAYAKARAALLDRRTDDRQLPQVLRDRGSLDALE